MEGGRKTCDKTYSFSFEKQMRDLKGTAEKTAQITHQEEDKCENMVV